MNTLRFFESHSGKVHLSHGTMLCGKVAAGVLQELCASPNRGTVCLRCLRKLRLIRQGKAATHNRN